MGRNQTHHSRSPVKDYGPSRKSQYRREKSPARLRESYRGRSPSSEKYSVHVKFPKHARSPSPFATSPRKKRLRRNEAREMLETEQERIKDRGVSRNLQEDGSNGYVRSRNSNFPLDRDYKNRNRHGPLHACDTRDKQKVTDDYDRSHSRWDDRRTHKEVETDKLEKRTVKESRCHLSSSLKHDMSPSEQHFRSRLRSYSPQYSWDRRNGETVMEEHEGNHRRGSRRSMHMEIDEERTDRIAAKDYSSRRSSRSTHCSPSDRNRRSRYRSQLPQYTGDTRNNETFIESCAKNYSRGNHRSRHREHDSPLDQHHSSRRRYHSPQHVGDTSDEEKVFERHQRFQRRETDRSMQGRKHFDKGFDRMTEQDSYVNRFARSRNQQSTSPLHGHQKYKQQNHFSEQAGDTRAQNKVPKSREAKDRTDRIDENDSVVTMRGVVDVLEEHKKEKSSFGSSGKLVVETSNSRGNGYGGDEKTRSICRLNLAPRKKKLLVFDLNGLLVHRVFCFNKDGIPRDRTSDGRCGNHLVYKRPFAEEFMLFCLERFEVGIWTSAMEKNIDGVLDCVMEKLRSRLIFVWDQHHCTDSGFKSLEKKMKPLYLKELRKLWNHFDGKFSASDTLLIDDEPYKALLNPLYTGIFLDSYIPDNSSDNALDPKKELGKYLTGLAVADDVPLYLKENPFGRPAISSEHPDWNFYSAVLRKFGKDL